MDNPLDIIKTRSNIRNIKMSTTNPLDIIKRLDVKQNVTIRIIDEPTGKVVQEHIGHNAATNSLLTGIAHYLMGDGVLNQGGDTLSTWVPQYISLGTMGLTSQATETFITEQGEVTIPIALGYTPMAPIEATAEEVELNARLRFSEYLNQTPGFGADGYDGNANNDREWFGLGRPYSVRPDALKQNFATWDGSVADISLSATPNEIISVTVFPNGIVDQDISHKDVIRQVLPSDKYSVSGGILHLEPAETPFEYPARVAIIYTIDSADAANCELLIAKIANSGEITSLTNRAKITYRDLVPEFSSEIPNTLDVVFSAMITTGALKEFRGNNDYVYITEAGLWSKPYYSESGDNGLLAGYRIMPSDDEVLELALEEQFSYSDTSVFTLQQQAISITSVAINGTYTDNYTFDSNNNTVTIMNTLETGDSIDIIYVYKNTDSWKNMDIPENRLAVQKSILRIGPNQVAQIVWKIQLGGLEQLNGLRYLYPSQYPEEVWNIV